MGTEWYWRSILLHEAHKLICQVYSTLQNWFLCVWFGGFCMKIIVYFVQNLLRLNRERRRKGQNSKKEAAGNRYINLRHLLKRVTPEPGLQPGLQARAPTIPRPQQTICRGAWPAFAAQSPHPWALLSRFWRKNGLFTKGLRKWLRKKVEL